jgi:hypothetical protein
MVISISLPQHHEQVTATVRYHVTLGLLRIDRMNARRYLSSIIDDRAVAMARIICRSLPLLQMIR